MALEGTHLKHGPGVSFSSPRSSKRAREADDAHDLLANLACEEQSDTSEATTTSRSIETFSAKLCGIPTAD
jgi:hypothetical protein